MSALKIYGGLEIKILARNLPDSTPVKGDDDYKKLKRKLDNYFIPEKNKHHATYTFNKQSLEPGERLESLVSYAARLREKTKDCKIEDRIYEKILEHLIKTIKDDDLIKRSIQKIWDLDRFIEEARQRDDINQQVTVMKDNCKITKLRD